MSKVKTDLLPCPICGSKVYSKVEFRGSNCATKIFDLNIQCQNHNCGLKKTTRLEICDTSFDDVINAINYAVTSWNKRYDKYEDDGK